MPYIAEFGGMFLLWKDSERRPVSHLMDEPDLIDYLRADLAADGIEMDMALHDARMAAVRKYGCSGGLYGPTKADLLAENHAGPDGAHVASEDEMVRLYSSQANNEK